MLRAVVIPTRPTLSDLKALDPIDCRGDMLHQKDLKEAEEEVEGRKARRSEDGKEEVVAAAYKASRSVTEFDIFSFSSFTNLR